MLERDVIHRTVRSTGEVGAKGQFSITGIHKCADLAWAPRKGGVIPPAIPGTDRGAPFGGGRFERNHCSGVPPKSGGSVKVSKPR